jgi:hypothetical protein
MPEFDSTTEYRQIEGFPGYMVGSDGSVWSCRKTVHRGWRYGSLPGISSTWRRLNPLPHKSGHLFITLMPNRKVIAIHRLVLEAFVGKRPKGMECRHFPDRDPSNNSLSNLQWGTCKENQADRIVHGTDVRGTNHRLAKLTEEDVREIRSELAVGWSQTACAKKRGLHKTTISQIARGVTWRHVV